MGERKGYRPVDIDLVVVAGALDHLGRHPFWSAKDAVVPATVGVGERARERAVALSDVRQTEVADLRQHRVRQQYIVRFQISTGAFVG